MRKFIKKLSVLSTLIIAPLTLTSFNKPTFAMKSNPYASIQPNSKSDDFKKLDAQLQEAMSELQFAYTYKNTPKKNKPWRK